MTNYQPEREFDVLVKADVFDDTDGQEAAWLRADEQIGRTVEFLHYLRAQLKAQMEAYDQGRSAQTPEWRRRVELFGLRITSRLAEVEPLLVERRERTWQALFEQAIEEHRKSVSIERTPSEADEALWALLDQSRASA